MINGPPAKRARVEPFNYVDHCYMSGCYWWQQAQFAQAIGCFQEVARLDRGEYAAHSLRALAELDPASAKAYLLGIVNLGATSCREDAEFRLREIDALRARDQFESVLQDPEEKVEVKRAHFEKLLGYPEPYSLQARLLFADYLSQQSATFDEAMGLYQMVGESAFPDLINQAKLQYARCLSRKNEIECLNSFDRSPASSLLFKVYLRLAEVDFERSLKHLRDAESILGYAAEEDQMALHMLLVKFDYAERNFSVVRRRCEAVLESGVHLLYPQANYYLAQVCRRESKDPVTAFELLVNSQHRVIGCQWRYEALHWMNVLVKTEQKRGLARECRHRKKSFADRDPLPKAIGLFLSGQIDAQLSDLVCSSQSKETTAPSEQFLLGWIYIEKEEFVKACEAFDKIKHVGEYYRLALALIAVLKHREDEPSATVERACHALIRELPETLLSFYAHYKLGLIYKGDKALFHLNRVKAMKPYHAPQLSASFIKEADRLIKLLSP